MNNLTFKIFATLRSTLAHGSFTTAGQVIPFRRENIVQRDENGNILLDDYAFQSSDPEQLEQLRAYALRLMNIVWQSKSDTKWTYAQLQDRIANASTMTVNLSEFMNMVLSRMGATTFNFYQDDAEFYDNIISAMDNVLILNLLRQPGERLLLTARMQVASQARHEKKELPLFRGSLFSDPDGDKPSSFKTKRAAYIPKVPVYSGNAFRNGVIRRHAARYILDRFGWYPSLDSFRNMFSGGSLQKTGEKGIDLEARRELIRLMPLYGLLGGSFNQNNMIEGSGKPLKLWPIVAEAKPALHPDLWKQADQLSMNEIMFIEANAAREDALLLAQDYIGNLPDDPKNPVYEKGTRNLKNKSMPFEREVIIAGTKLYSEWSSFHSEPLQIGAWVSSFVSWAQWSVLGGVSNHGHGATDIEVFLPDGDMFLSVNHKILKIGDKANKYLKEYETHLKKHKAELKVLLECSDTPPDGYLDTEALQVSMIAEEQD